jgi:phosphate transport system substrate-binding protein
MRANIVTRATNVVLLLAAVCTASCKGPPTREPLLIAGSTTMREYLEGLEEEFERRNPTIDVVFGGGGTAAGAMAVKKGAVDVAMMGRDLSASEDDLTLRNYLLARDSVVVITNPSNPVDGLSLAQLKAIYLGEVRSWKDVGGQDSPIVVYEREWSDRSRKSFGALALSGDSDGVVQSAKTAPSADEMISAIRSNPSAIGYLPMNRMSKDVKNLRIDGVEVSRITVLSGRYPLTRSFYLVVSNPPRSAEKFVEFALSADGEGILAKNGLIPTF